MQESIKEILMRRDNQKI